MPPSLSGAAAMRGGRRAGAVALQLLLLVACSNPPFVSGWRQWTWDGDVRNISYSNRDFFETDGPFARRGHSLVLRGSDQVIVFGGMSNNEQNVHQPKTFEIEEIDGSLEFTSYDQKEVVDCKGKQTKECKAFPYITRAAFFNDVWAYNMSCERYGMDSCVDQGWTQLNMGMKWGGCKYADSVDKTAYILQCTHPTERYHHMSGVFDNEEAGDGGATMVVYGGFSEFCQDYCDDMWGFNLTDGSWRMMYKNVPPGKRWKASSAFDDNRLFIFGGHRLWHGFSAENSVDNLWESLDSLPNGGYLDDLWVYTHNVPGQESNWFEGYYGQDGTKEGNWTQLPRLDSCYADPGELWAERNDVTCVVSWPSGRAGAAMALRTAHGTGEQQLWLHGGFRTQFPYPKSSSSGAGAGSAVDVTGASTGTTLFPSLPYFLQDMWRFDIATGLWHEVASLGAERPGPRYDHFMVWVHYPDAHVPAGGGDHSQHDALIVHGGYRSNHLYKDLWSFNTTTSVWLEKKTFVNGLYPDTCVNDAFAEWWADQDYWSEDDFNGPSGKFAPVNQQRLTDFLVANPLAGGGYPEALYDVCPVDAEGNAEVSDTCSAFGELAGVMSVQAVPTRLFPDAATLTITQPMRQAYGWDGCRDRLDGRDDDGIYGGFPSELQWEMPVNRFSHRAVYAPEQHSLVMFGGFAYTQQELEDMTVTKPTEIVGDFWLYSLDACPFNCSGQGECINGYCFCHDGYYGLDCSNTSCPGDFCYYDEDTHEQICSHCCYAGYTASDDDVYLRDTRKIPCSHEEPGAANGICDGFGHCQCAPPFIGQDCSIRDCPDGCNDHGSCLVEFPVSRCQCDAGYYGEACKFRKCLNNCSYPNGECNIETGRCDCRMLYSPFNRSRPYRRYEGDDCSFIPAYAAGAAPSVSAAAAAAAAVLAACGLVRQ